MLTNLALLLGRTAVALVFKGKDWQLTQLILVQLD